MFMSKPEHFLIIARPMRPVADDGRWVLPVTLVAKEGAETGCHGRPTFAPATKALTLPHIFRASMPKGHEKKRTSGGRLGQHVRRCFANGTLVLVGRRHG